MVLRRLLLPIGVLFVLVGAAVMGDWYAQNREMDRLLTRIEEAEETVNRYGPDTGAVFDDYAGRGPVPPEERAAFFVRLANVAEASSREVAERVEAVDEIRFLPWHRDLKRARDAYVAHAAHWQAYLRSVVRDAEANYPERAPVIFESYEGALADLRRAVPPRPSKDFEARIEELEP